MCIYLIYQPESPQIWLQIYLSYVFVLVMEVDDIEPKVTVSYYVLKFPNMHV